MTTPTTARKSCRACGHETSRPVDACPNCGDVYQTTTTAAQHTPGPWHVGIRPGPMVYGQLGEQIADCRGLDEAGHNARVIAHRVNTWPALLAALEALTATPLPLQLVNDRDWLAAKAAIRQAKGEG